MSQIAPLHDAEIRSYFILCLKQSVGVQKAENGDRGTTVFTATLKEETKQNKNMKIAKIGRQDAETRRLPIK